MFDVTNGPLPCDVFQVDINATPSSEALSPPDPNRTAAQIRSGSGVMIARIMPAAVSLPNTRKLTTTVQNASTDASKYCESLALRNHEIPWRTNITIVGMRIRFEMMFDESRVVHSIQ